MAMLTQANEGKRAVVEAKQGNCHGPGYFLQPVWASYPVTQFLPQIYSYYCCTNERATWTKSLHLFLASTN